MSGRHRDARTLRRPRDRCRSRARVSRCACTSLSASPEAGSTWNMLGTREGRRVSSLAERGWRFSRDERRGQGDLHELLVAGSSVEDGGVEAGRPPAGRAAQALGPDRRVVSARGSRSARQDGARGPNPGVSAGPSSWTPTSMLAGGRVVSPPGDRRVLSLLPGALVTEGHARERPRRGGAGALRGLVSTPGRRRRGAPWEKPPTRIRTTRLSTAAPRGSVRVADQEDVGPGLERDETKSLGE